MVNKISLKDIILLTVATIISLLLVFATPFIKFDVIYVLYFLVGLIAFLILGIGWAIGIKNKEIEERLNKQETEQKRLMEKLKIYEQLINMKADIKELQKEVFKNGKK